MLPAVTPVASTLCSLSQTPPVYALPVQKPWAAKVDEKSPADAVYPPYTLVQLANWFSVVPRITPTAEPVPVRVNCEVASLWPQWGYIANIVLCPSMNEERVHLSTLLMVVSLFLSCGLNPASTKRLRQPNYLV